MIPTSLDALKSHLVALPTEDRAELAQFLIETLEPASERDTEAAWEAELTRRVEEIRSGRVVGKLAEEVFAEVDGRFP